MHIKLSLNSKVWSELYSYIHRFIIKVFRGVLDYARHFKLHSLNPAFIYIYFLTSIKIFVKLFCGWQILIKVRLH